MAPASPAPKRIPIHEITADIMDWTGAKAKAAMQKLNTWLFGLEERDGLAGAARWTMTMTISHLQARDDHIVTSRKRHRKKRTAPTRTDD